MAAHGRAYGMSAELQKKAKAKYDPELERQASEWISALTGTAINDFAGDLKDGVLLCKAMNVLQPGAVKKINETKMPFKQMENIGCFLDAADKYGVARNDLFQTVDLFEAKNMNQVVDGIHALGRAAQKHNFSGPVIGAKESSAAPRNFSEDKLKAGEQIVPAQAGFAGGANQKGMSFGTTRHM